MRLPTFLTDAIARRLWATRTRKPDVVIGGDARPYMLRWHLARSKWFGGAYLHYFLRDDDDRALHDHPWTSLSLVLSGGTDEVYCPVGLNASDPANHRRRCFKRGALIWRAAAQAHRVILPNGPAWTLFIIGPKSREWGFWCPKGFRHWREYSKPGAPGEIGKGCAE